jgi:hypothetical protein
MVAFLTLVTALACGDARAYVGLVINARYESSVTSDPNHAAIGLAISEAKTNIEIVIPTNVSASIKFTEMSSGLGERSRDV